VVSSIYTPSRRLHQSWALPYPRTPRNPLFGAVYALSSVPAALGITLIHGEFHRALYPRPAVAGQLVAQPIRRPSASAVRDAEPVHSSGVGVALRLFFARDLSPHCSKASMGLVGVVIAFRARRPAWRDRHAHLALYPSVGDAGGAEWRRAASSWSGSGSSWIEAGIAFWCVSSQRVPIPRPGCAPRPRLLELARSLSRFTAACVRHGGQFPAALPFIFSGLQGGGHARRHRGGIGRSSLDSVGGRGTCCSPPIRIGTAALAGGAGLAQRSALLLGRCP